MFPPQFDYERPDSLDAALDALADEDAVPLAGGHDLVPMLKARERTPGTVVDLGGLAALRGVERVVADGTERLSIGALTTDAALLDADPAGVDALLDATSEVGDAQIRNRGTVGGNLAAAHPASDIPAATLAAGATLHLVGPDGDRTVPAGEFATGDHETVCTDDELVTRVSVPLDPDAGGAYARKTHPSTGYAAVGVAARLRVVDGAVADPRVAAVGLLDVPTRLPAVEGALVGVDAGSPVDAVAGAAERATEGIDGAVREDHVVSAGQRCAVLPEYTERAVSAALARAVGREGVVA
ncbi:MULTISPECIES: FAD binding domain-containing protein [Halolamina]|uniref:Carbon-monoxide dehydrogenase medium subunit n=1 Tax=Halolamina pelagica TaxID=699431 RepID=A0A1I5QW05_9EURY|nr:MULTISPECIES: FAD binding domain-containing protein [Halolamina]NHX35562.1 xanthine dehydrogenase family protein subunit M [Halolamina sp. R1-12]SFP50267.1 carbon-monoxide dehydrogenase medium subunit [Halolamina pelagica]